jgi:hypothetical protein
MGLWSRLRRKLPILWTACLLAGPAFAQGGAPDAGLCENAILAGARATGVPQEVLHAISLTETGRVDGGRLRPWPWAINREGRGHWFRTRAEAMAFARQSIADGRPSFDVGCFQINYRYHGHKFVSLEQMFDPEAAAIYAGRFLRDLYGESGNWSVAAGAYHSRTPHFASIYRNRFDRIRAGLATATPLVAVALPQAAGGPAEKRRSRVRMVREPLIITVDSARLSSGSRRVAHDPDGAHWNLLTQVAFDAGAAAERAPSAGF